MLFIIYGKIGIRCNRYMNNRGQIVKKAPYKIVEFPKYIIE